MDYKDETAFLTGGASGIGKAVTKMLVEKGMKVFVVDTDIQGLRALGKELNTDSQNPCIWTADCDVSDWDDQLRAFKTAVGVFSNRIDYVFPIAGIGERRSFPNKPQAEEFERPDLRVLEVDEIGCVYTVSLAVQHFRRLEKNGYGCKGKIVAVASVCGFYIHPPLPVYTAAKHAVVGFVRSFGKILAEENITLNAVCPSTNIGTAEAYEKAEKAGVLVPMEKLLEAFEMLLSKGEYKELSGECVEVAPKLGIRVVPKTEFVNEESKISADITYQRSRHLHDVVE